MANIDHIMPKPVVVPISWGHDYVVNTAASDQLKQMVSDLVTGPFMNGQAQYGVRRGTIIERAIIDDTNPPATITYFESTEDGIDTLSPPSAPDEAPDGLISRF